MLAGPELRGEMRPQSNWTPTIVPNRANRTDGETSVSNFRGAIQEPSLSALNATYTDYPDGSSENTLRVSRREGRSPADIRFAMVLAFALALPALIGIGIYIATTAVLRAS
jgi:hypothetical protein